MKAVEITYRYGVEDVSLPGRPTTSDEACLRLEGGNRAFAHLFTDMTGGTATARRVIRVDPRDLGLAGPAGTVPAQQPYAAVLGCSDARVPVELVFNEGPNDLFVMRVAGNLLGDDVLASLQYALDHLGDSLKLVVVLGHSGCGAVTAAVDAFLDPASYLNVASEPMLRHLLDRVLIVAHAADRRLAALHGADIRRESGYRAALVEAAVALNAALAAHSIAGQFQAAREGRVRVMWGVYGLADRALWAPTGDDGDHSGLAAAPIDEVQFRALGDRVLGSQRIGALLKRGAQGESAAGRPPAR